jgi:hypothetical protein
MLVVESNLPVMSVENSSGPEAGKGSAALISDAEGSVYSTEVLGSELVRVQGLSSVVEDTEVDVEAVGGGLVSDMVGSELALIPEQSVPAEDAGVIVEAVGVRGLLGWSPTMVCWILFSESSLSLLARVCDALPQCGFP